MKFDPSIPLEVQREFNIVYKGEPLVTKAENLKGN